MPRVSEAEREERIKRCAELVNQGLSRKDIAQQLGVSLPTVFNYIRAAKKQGLLSEDEKERKREEAKSELLRDLQALADNAPAIESLVSHINFNQPPREVLKQVENIKMLYKSEISALGYLSLIFEAEGEQQLKELGVDLELANQLRKRFANILKYAKVLYMRDRGIENRWSIIGGRSLFNFDRNEPLLEIEIHSDLESFKTRDRLENILRIIFRLLLHCRETIHEVSSSHLPIDPDDLESYREILGRIGIITQEALEDLRERGK